MNSTLTEKAVIMRFSLGLPGETRQDPTLTKQVQTEHDLGKDAGRWLKQLYPKKALEKIKQLDGEARKAHDEMTLPWDNGMGILPGGLVFEYGEVMGAFRNKRKVLINEFLSNPLEWVEWAKDKHNGTFDPGLYPGASIEPDGSVSVDAEKFRTEMIKKFYFVTEPNPVPTSEHFTETMASLLGDSVTSVDSRRQEIVRDAQEVLLKRLLEPVKHMAEKLAEEPKVLANGKMATDIRFRDSLVKNLEDIARIAPSLNISDSPEIDAFIQAVDELSQIKPQELRDDKNFRAEAQAKADALAKKMSAYQF